MAPDLQIAAEAFIERWRGVTASELSTAQSFVIDLCDLLGVDKPHATPEQDYMFERPVTFTHGDGTTSAGRIDCYRRAAFVLESKKVKAGADTKGFDDALLRARAQGEGYARALPASEGRPPFVVVVDVGRVIELYSEFTRSGATYTPFPDPRSHRIKLDDLRQEAVRERLKALWIDPMALDPARVNAKVTRDVAVHLAGVARSLEDAGLSPHDVAAFLTRCLFSMFAEDVELLPRLPNGAGAFVDLLKRYRDDPPTLQKMIGALWADMDSGGFSAALAKQVLRFNGKLFKGPGSANYVLSLSREQIDGLLNAARASWKEVEPSIFGTLLERALHPDERQALGAHYTPRAYVERLVLPTVVEPLRAEWANAQAAALLLANEANSLEGKKRDDKLAEARKELRLFHHRLCTVRILDPACGSGNFLYVTLEHLKRLEGEVLNQLEALGDTQSKLGLEGETVTLQQLRGIELNERAAALAELVLWIGYLQWHIRTFGNTSVVEPVVHDYGNIEYRDAVLAYDSRQPMLDAAGKVVTRWDGETVKPHPVTGQFVPDESAQVPQWQYTTPRPATWPEVNFIVGNPPFIGAKYVREALGDGYAEALRQAWPAVPESADYVMYWWHHAAQTVRAAKAERFGFITTNSVRQTFNRRVVEAQQDAKPPLYLVFAIPDHPWVDSKDGAAVRIAMTVGALSGQEGRLLTVTDESPMGYGEVDVKLSEQRGVIHSDLAIGVDLAAAATLQANRALSSPGVKLHGSGFIVPADQAPALGVGTTDGVEQHIREYRNGRDLTDRSRDVFVIDLYGLSSDETRLRYPAVFQWVLERVKPQRDQNNRRTYRDNWWLFGEPRGELRQALAGLSRFIVTPVTSKHRTFQFLPSDVLADDALMCIASDDALHLGILSSSVHCLWALRTGSTLEDRPRYIKSRCFETFPFPDADTGLTPTLTERIRALAEQIDAHRKARQAAHADVTLTGMYNVLAKLRSGEALTPAEQTIHEHGLVAVLRTLHDDLDVAVLAAYGWSDLRLPDDVGMLLMRLFELNARRVGEEAAGTVRWLRQPFQQAGGEQAELEVEHDGKAEALAPITPATIIKKPWPAGLPDQIKAVAAVLASTSQQLTLDALADHFTGRGRWRNRLPTILETLEALGRVRRADDGRWSNVAVT